MSSKQGQLVLRNLTGWQQVNVRLAKLKVPPDHAAGGRVGCAAPQSNHQLPVRKVPGWRAFGFPPALWAAPRRMPGAEETGEGEASPWYSDVYWLPGLPL